MDAKLIAAVKAAFPDTSGTLILGAPVHENVCEPAPLIGIPVAMMNRHGLIAGATGTSSVRFPMWTCWNWRRVISRRW